MTDTAGDLAAADDRVAAFLDALARLPDGAFVSTSLPAPAPDPAIDAAVVEATRLAVDHGLSDLLDRAQNEARAAVLRRYDAGGYRPTMAGLNWGVSEGRAQDRVAGVVAVEDAITAAVVEPWASAALLTTLSSPFELIQRGGEVAPTFDLSEATARRLDPAWRGSGPVQGLLIGGVVIAAVISLAVGSWAWIPFVVIALVAIGSRLARGRV